MKEKNEEELTQIRLNLKTLNAQKKASRKLSDEKEKMLEDLTAREEKLSTKIDEINIELEELNSYIEMLEHKGKVCAEKTIFSGVDVYIKDKVFPLKDPYNHVKISLVGGEINISEYEPPEQDKVNQRIGLLTAKRR